MWFPDINECVSNSCVNGGTCFDGVARYTCTCVTGYTGTNCQTSELYKEQTQKPNMQCYYVKCYVKGTNRKYELLFFQSFFVLFLLFLISLFSFFLLSFLILSFLPHQFINLSSAASVLPFFQSNLFSIFLLTFLLFPWVFLSFSVLI